MRRVIAISAAAVFAFLLFAGIRAAADNTAMVISVTGDVKVVRGDKQKAIKGKFPLQTGDKVVAGKGGSAVVLFGTGKKVTVTSTLEITDAAGKIDGAKPAGADLVKSSVAGGGKNKDLKSKGGVGGAVRAAGDKKTVRILSVMPGSTITTRPVFAWEPSADADSSTVVLMNEDGEEVWKTKTSDKVAAYPADKDPLSNDTEYTVEVTSTIDGDEVSGASTFYVVGEKDAKEIEDNVKAIQDEYKEGDDLIIQHLVLAQYYKQMEMYDAAVDELKKLIALDKYDVNSHYELADIYSKTGDKEALKKEVETITALEKELGIEEGF